MNNIAGSISSEVKSEKSVQPTMSKKMGAETSQGDCGIKKSLGGADGFSGQDVSVFVNGQEQDTDKKKVKKEITAKDTKEMAEALNRFMENLNCDIQFKYHEKLDLLSIKMINKRTKEVIKEFPPEKILEAMEKTQEWIGVFLDKKA